MSTNIENRQAQAAELFEFLTRKFQKQLGKSLSTRVVYGYIDHDECEKDRYSVRVFTFLGERLSGVVQQISDAQSGWIHTSASASDTDIELPAVEEKIAFADLWMQARDESASIQHRLEAIHKLLGSDRNNAIVYLATELARQGAQEDWVLALVFLVEDVHFPADRQQSIKDALLRIAGSFRKSTKAGADRVVWSAIRRAASLLEPTQVNLLVPFLEREGVVDARAVTLKCVEKLFLPAPPANPELVRPVGDRAYTLAQKFLDPDIFGGGEHALLAQSAVCTLAAIGDARVSDATTLAARLNRRWLKHQLRTRLDILRTSWQSKGTEVTGSSAFHKLESELTKLN
jgi:hypothetical protein